MKGAFPCRQDERGFLTEGHHQIQMKGEEKKQMMNEEGFKYAK
jgi:hypothetical protein